MTCAHVSRTVLYLTNSSELLQHPAKGTQSSQAKLLKHPSNLTQGAGFFLWSVINLALIMRVRPIIDPTRIIKVIRFCIDGPTALSDANIDGWMAVDSARLLDRICIP